ncbi:HAD family hydrolase [Pseudanabaena sp. 'Roaring Creek']|uniref:HAD family hydrolase n=1 Tax=Pseudanabaena sp. 'Roaring Creek' TaxID=1681830 RepID=UPI0006D7CB64|nr:HAD family hydrolase [Pseudanabaena sp. 'Roaring Creek']
MTEKNGTIKLIVFDMAGTTVKDDREVENCFMQSAKKTGLRADPDRVVAMMGLPKKIVFQTLWAEQIASDAPDYNARVETSFIEFKQVLEEHYLTQPVEPTEGCLELFDWLRSQQINIALTTGFYREVTDIILKRLGWDRGLNHNYVGSRDSLIQASVTPSEIYNQEGRPAPYMIQKAMYQLGIRNPQEVICIGDTPSDLASGRNANCLYAFGVTNGTHTAEQLAPHPNDGLFASLSEFQSKLLSL